MTLLATNKTGYDGVSYCRERKAYRAMVYLRGRQKCLGFFEDVHDAGCAASDWRIQNADEIQKAKEEAYRKRQATLKKTLKRKRQS